MYLVCGEALYDVFLDGEDDSGGLRLEARSGGSPFNVAIGIARLGGRAALLTGISRDVLGERLVRTLEKESVSTHYLIRSGRRTTLSLVGIDRAGQPDYVFYGLGSADCSVTPGDLPEIGPEITGLHFGSYSTVVRPVADALSTLAGSSRGRFISVDPNVRTMIEPDLEVWRARIGEYASCADLLKISTEDLHAVYPDADPGDVAADLLAAGVKLVVITDGGEKVRAWTRGALAVRVTPPPTAVVDTVGAGDSFQAALLAGLSEDGDGDPRAAVEALDEARLESLLKFAVSAARITCGRRGANLPRRDEVPAFDD